MWRECSIPARELELACYEAGEGPAVLFLHGGPGDDHRYLRSAAEPLARHFRCVLYDQRGSGRSRVEPLDETTLHVPGFLADLEALRAHLGEERLRLAGHSWGAMLALLYGITYPKRVERMALIGMGPLTPELAAVARANLLRALSIEERDEWTELTGRRRAALEAEDRDAYLAVHARRMALYFRGAFYSPEQAERYLEQYLATGDHYNAAVVNRHVTASWRNQPPVWDRLQRIEAPVLLLYGYQDFEPINQAYLVRDQLPQARLALLNECGHLPWVEQPALFAREMEAFFGE